MFVLRVLQVLMILLPLISKIHSDQQTTHLVNTTNTESNDTRTANKTENLIHIDAVTSETTPGIPVYVAEGGNLNVKTTPVTQGTTDTSSTTVSTVEHAGREGEITIQANVNDTLKSVINATRTTIVHNGTSSTTEKTTSVSQKVTTLADVSVSIPEGHRKTVPKKGVNYTETHVNYTEILSKLHFGQTTPTAATTSKIPTTIKILPKKPTATFSSDDEEAADFVKAKISNSTPKVPTVEFYEENKERSKTNFVIPIVAVILSVPIVAIVANILYKRGKEWWIHRHYSRMDFLVDGMYNS